MKLILAFLLMISGMFNIWSAVSAYEANKEAETWHRRALYVYQRYEFCLSYFDEPVQEEIEKFIPRHLQH